MANHKSAKKRIRRNNRRRLIKKSGLSALRTLEKNLQEVIKKKEKPGALKLLQTFYSKMDSAVRKGLQKKNRVRRKKSRLSQLVNNI